MPDIILPGTAGDVRLTPTLQLIVDLERECGSLFKAAEQLVRGELDIKDVLALLRIIYHAAGYEENLEQLMEQKYPDFILAQAMTELLNPLYHLGAVREGKPKTALNG